MANNIIYIHKIDRIPYFYIIQHIPSEKFYVGCKYGKDANPNTFMTEDGYQTSSNNVKKLISDDGIQSFKIIQLLTEKECGVGVLYYETRFIRENNITARYNWINLFQNQTMSYGTQKFSDAIMRKYGVSHPSQSKQIMDKKIESSMIKYGVEYPIQTKDVKEKSKNTNIKRLGVEYPMQSEIVKIKSKETCLKNYGVEYNMMAPIIRYISRNTCLEKYGVEYPTQSKEIHNKCKNTWIKNLGVDNPSKSEAVKNKKAETNYKNWGNNPAKLKFMCPKCGHVSSMCGLTKHAKKCFALFGDMWIKPKTVDEWLIFKFEELSK